MWKVGNEAWGTGIFWQLDSAEGVCAPLSTTCFKYAISITFNNSTRSLRNWLYCFYLCWKRWTKQHTIPYNPIQYNNTKCGLTIADRLNYIMNLFCCFVHPLHIWLCQNNGLVNMQLTSWLVTARERSNNELIFPLDFCLNSFGHQERYTCPSLALHPLEESFVAQTNGNYMAVFSSQRPYRMNKRRRYEGHKVSNDCSLKGVRGWGGVTQAWSIQSDINASNNFSNIPMCTKLCNGCRINLYKRRNTEF